MVHSLHSENKLLPKPFLHKLEEPSKAEILNELGDEMVKYFCKKASVMFFEEYGLIRHLINSSFLVFKLLSIPLENSLLRRVLILLRKVLMTYYASKMKVDVQSFYQVFIFKCGLASFGSYFMFLCYKNWFFYLELLVCSLVFVRIFENWNIATVQVHFDVHFEMWVSMIWVPPIWWFCVNKKWFLTSKLLRCPLIVVCIF